MRHHSLPAILAAAAIILGLGVLAWRDAPARAAGSAPEPSAHPARQVLVDPVQARSIMVGNSELLVLDVQPSNPPPLLPVSQRCYVWRDTEFKTASLTCPPGDDAMPPLAPPPPSFER